MKMSATVILNKLKRGEYDELDTIVKNHLSTLRKSPKNCDLIKFVHSFVANAWFVIKDAEFEDAAFLIEIVWYCNECFWKDEKIKPDKLTQEVTRVLYHVLELLSKQNLAIHAKIFDLILTTAKHLEKCFDNLKNGKEFSRKLCHNSCFYLSQTAKECMKRKNVVKNDAMSFNLQKLALKFIDREKDTVGFSTLCKQSLSFVIDYVNTGKTDFPSLILYYEDTFRQICEHFDLGERNLICLTAVIEFLLGWFFYLLKNDAVWKVDPLKTVENWDRFSLSLKLQPNLRLLWDFNIDVSKLSAIFSSLKNVNENSKKFIEDAIRRCVDFLQKNKKRDYDEILSKCLLFLWDSLKRNFDTLLEQTKKNNFGFYGHQIGNFFLEFMKWEFSKEKSYEDKTHVILKAFFSLLENRSKILVQIGEDEKLKEDVEVLGNIIYKFGNALVKFGIPKYNQDFAYSACRVAFTFYNKKLYKSSVLVSSFFQKDLILVSHSNSSSEWFEKNFWTFAVRYVWTLNMLKRRTDSLNFIARTLAADCKDQKQAIQLWTNTKLGGNLETKISVLDLVSKYISDGKTVDFNALLIMEANSACEYSSKHRVDVSDDILHIVNQLKCKTTNKIDKAILLITKAKLLGVDSNNLERKLMNSCVEARELIGNQNSSEPSQAKCYLAHSYFCQYVIESRLKCNKLAEKIDSAKQQPSNYTTISMSLKCTGNLDLALNIWTSVISSDMKLIPCLKNCLKDLLGMASAYSVQRMTKNEFKSLTLALNVAGELNDHVTVGYVSCQIAKIFCQYGLTAQATEYLLGAKEAIERSNDKVEGDEVKAMEMKYLKLFVDVCSSESLLLQNEVIKGWRCLRYVVRELQALPSSTIIAKLLTTEAKLLKSKYLELPFSILPLSERDDRTPLEVIHSAYSQGFAIAKHANDYKFADLHSRIINSFIDSSLHLGKMYLNIGDPAKASTILHWAFHWAYKLSLSKRVADIILLKAKINIMSDDFESCQSNLRTVKCIFQSQEEITVDENESKDDDLDLELITTTNNIDNLEDVDISKIEYNSSPVLENLDMKDHESNCTCALCEQLLFPITCLEFSSLQAQCFYLKDVNRNHSISILRKKRRNFEMLSSRISSLILESLSFGNKLSGISSKNIYSSFYLLKLDIVNKLTTFSLEKGDVHEAHLMAKAAAEEAKTYYWIGLQDLRVATAHIKYSYCLTKLLKHAQSKKMPVNDIFNKMWSFSTLLADTESDFEWEYDFLESKISKIRLNDVDLAKNFKTPKQNSRSTRVAKCKAPRKNNLRSLRPNQFDEDTDYPFTGGFQLAHKATEEKENEDTVNFSYKNVRRKLIVSKASPGVPVLKERNGAQSESPVLVTDKFVSFLEAVIEQIAHFPVYPLYGDLHLLLALCKGNRRTDSGIHLFETFGLTLRHRSLFESTSRLLYRNSGDSNRLSVDNYEKTCQHICSFIHLTTDLDKDSEELCINYEKRLNDLNSLLNEGIVVCQINTLPKAFYHHSQQLNSELIITRWQKGRAPLVIKVPNDNSRVVNGFLSSFQNIIDDHNNDSKITDRRAWRKFREEANDKIKLSVTDVENRWLDHWKGLLLGTPALVEDRRTLKKIVEKLNFEFLELGFSNVNFYILETIVDSLPWLSSKQLRQALASLLFLGVADKSLEELCKKVRQYAKPLRSKTVPRHLLILVLDKSISSLPWESIPILENNTVTRMPSIYSILVHASLNQHPKPIDSSKAFYVLDPESNLPYTAECFESFVKSLNWSGICQRRPSSAEWEAAIKDNELFFYGGHGNGRQFYDSKSLSKQVCKATLILAGCSSVKLRAVNHFEANGDVLQYIMAGSPCVVGTLWIVTDREIDAVMKKMLNMFLPSSKVRRTMCEALIAGRAACQLKYITGAATIVYGMPVIAK